MDGADVHIGKAGNVVRPLNDAFLQFRRRLVRKRKRDDVARFQAVSAPLRQQMGYPSRYDFRLSRPGTCNELQIAPTVFHRTFLRLSEIHCPSPAFLHFVAFVRSEIFPGGRGDGQGIGPFVSFVAGVSPHPAEYYRMGLDKVQ